MRDLEDLRRAAIEHDLADLADVLVSLARPALRLLAAEDTPPAGRLGGLPRLPVGAAWPRRIEGDGAGEPLAFLGELDLAALDPSAWTGPRDGSLSLFCHVHANARYVDDPGAPLVLHHAADEARTALAAPSDLPTAELLFDELTVRTETVLSLPSTEVLWRHGVQHEFGDPDYSRVFDGLAIVADLASGLDPEDHPMDRPGTHRVGGWSPQGQSDVEGTWSHWTPGVAPDDWALLLHLGADSRTGSSFGDGGDHMLGIPTTDLAAGRFDRVQGLTDST